MFHQVFGSVVILLKYLYFCCALFAKLLLKLYLVLCGWGLRWCFHLYSIKLIHMVHKFDSCLNHFFTYVRFRIISILNYIDKMVVHIRGTLFFLFVLSQCSVIFLDSNDSKILVWFRHLVRMYVGIFVFRLLSLIFVNILIASVFFTAMYVCIVYW